MKNATSYFIWCACARGERSCARAGGRCICAISVFNTCLSLSTMEKQAPVSLRGADLGKSQAPAKPPRPSIQKKVTVQASPIDSMEIRTMSDFTRGARAVFGAAEFSRLARQVGVLKLCGCLNTDAQDAEHGLLVIPREYTPYTRPYNVYCDAENCNYFSIIKKYARIELNIVDLNVTEAFMAPMLKKMETQMQKKCVISMCKRHFFQNLINDCPPCAQKFGLIKCK